MAKSLCLLGYSSEGHSLDVFFTRLCLVQCVFSTCCGTFRNAAEIYGINLGCLFVDDFVCL